MSYVTFKEFREAVTNETDTQDEKFIDFDELIAFTNQGLTIAESLIYSLNEDYFLDFDYLKMNIDQFQYDLPQNILAAKIRGMLYQAGSKKYEVKRVRNLRKFEKIQWIEDVGAQDDYRYIVMNPRFKNLAVTISIASPGVFTSTAHGLVQDERVTFKTEGTLPTGIVEGTEYYVNYLTADTFEVSATIGGTSIDLSGSQSGTHKVRNSGPKLRLLPKSRENSTQNVRIWFIRNCEKIPTNVSRTVADETVMDIPEFHDFVRSFVKYKILAKEGTDLASSAEEEMKAFQQIMVDTLTQQTPDNDDELEQDDRFYEEHA